MIDEANFLKFQSTSFLNKGRNDKMTVHQAFEKVSIHFLLKQRKKREYIIIR
ncbi:hypothetical protein LEP1GSC081_3121 [Leptospira kirschneri str. H1]|uniref:Uncharacterized protein n=1 Tax=Leptospira kirschneri str. H1 TaxID=1049966 RepID=A0A0E2AZ52_9LEPT|nr:hypothetical protein LEP1GSC081_3121 [Leptospira kirschneri str. H1]